jgi:hypothetical protein
MILSLFFKAIRVTVYCIYKGFRLSLALVDYSGEHSNNYRESLE